MKRTTTIISIMEIVIFIFFLLLHCSRDNPFDINSDSYIPGKKPHVNFVDSLITGYLFDTINVSISWSDTAIGGLQGIIKKCYFDWDGDGKFSDSLTGIFTNPLVISRAFPPQKNWVRIKAIDIEGDTSAIDSIWLEIKQSTPVITSVQAPETVGKGVPFTITVNSSDTGGVITSYHWAIDERTFSRTTDSGFISVTFNEVGEKTVLVKARDNKKIESPTSRILTIRVIDPSDSVGPEITFVSPLDGDVVYSRLCNVSVQAVDASEISGITLNNSVAMKQIVGAIWRGAVNLKDGENVLSVEAIDTKRFTRASSVKITYIVPNVDLTSPAVTLLAPAKWTDTINTETLIVRLSANDESGISNVFFNTEIMQYNLQDSSYSTNKKLQEGANRFFIRAVDKKGNARVDTLSVFWEKNAIDTTAPVITITEPRYLQHISDSIVTVRGTVTDASGITSINVNGNDAFLNYPIWSATARLYRGYDTIKVVAIDGSNSGNTAKTSVVVLNNKVPGFVKVPIDTFVSINENLTFSATTMDDDSLLTFSIKRSSTEHGRISPLVTDKMKTSFTYTATDAGIDTLRLFVKDPWDDVDSVIWHVGVFSLSDSTPRFTTKNLPDTITVGNSCKASVRAQDPHGLPLVYSLTNQIPVGITIDSISGVISWIPVISDTGKKVIQIQVNNGKQRSSLIWNVTVLPPNLPPQLSIIQNQNIDENQKLQMTIIATDPNNDPLEFMFGSTFPTGAQLDSNRFSWTPSFLDAGTHRVVFVVKERNRTPSLIDSQTITITVKNVNQKPRLTNPGTITGVINQSMSYAVSALDPDSDQVTFSMFDSPAGAILTGNRFTWTPTATGSYTVKFVASDLSLSDTATVAIKVNKANEAPSLTSPGNKSVNENQMLQFTLSAADPDGDSLAYTMENGPTGSKLEGKEFSWKPDFTQSGTYTVKFIVKDNLLPPLSDSKTITIIVNNINAPPVLTNPGNKTVDENSELSFNLSATDIDSNTLSFSMSNAPQGAKLSGTTFTWKPALHQSGDYRVTFFVVDNGTPALRDSQSITITVKNFNQAPLFTDSASQVVNENSKIQFQLLAYDPDGAALRYRSLNLPTGALLSQWGLFEWTPNNTQAGNYRVVFIALDTSNQSAVLSDTTTITINVNNVNRAPVFTDSTAQTGTERQAISFQLSANDPDSNKLSFTAVKLPGSSTLSSSGAFSWTPSISSAGTYNVVFIVRDSSTTSAILSDTATIKITVSNLIPAVPTPVLPSNDATTQPRSISFRWNKANAAETYFFQLARDTGFANIYQQDSLVTDTTRVVSGLSGNTTYFWRVRSLNPGARSDWSSRRVFTTIRTFAITINATNGTVATNPSNGPFDSASIVTLTATPASGYRFASWSGGVTGTSNPENVTMDAAKTVTATFALRTYTLQLTSDAGGSITPTSSSVTVNHNVATAITARADSAHTFVKWTVTNGSARFDDSTDASTNVTLTADATIRAVFSVKTYELRVRSRKGGTITEPAETSSTVSHGARTTITATAGTSYRFSYWTVTSGRGNAIIADSLSPTTTVSLIGAATIHASYRYTLTVEPPINGRVTTPSSNTMHVDYETPVAIVADPDDGYRFTGWEITSGSGATIADTRADSTTISLTDNASIRATFSRIFYTLTLSRGNGGDIVNPRESSVSAAHGEPVQIIAQASPGYRFVKWSVINGSATITDTNQISTTVALRENATVRAIFIKTFRLSVVQQVGGMINQPSADTTVDSGATTGITAAASQGYTFTEWSRTGAGIISQTTSPSTTITVNGNVTLRAIFSIRRFRLEVTAGDNGHIQAPIGDTLNVPYDSIVTINAQADTGYRFSSWTAQSGTAQSDTAFIANRNSASTTVRIRADAVIRANFIKTFVLTVEQRVGGTITPSSMTVDSGVPTTISVKADTGYRFTGWNIVSGTPTIVRTTDTSATVTLDEDATINANFIKTYFLTVDSTVGGTITPLSMTVDSGVPTTISVKEDPGYDFLNWEVSPGSDSANAIFSSDQDGSPGQYSNPATVTIRGDVGIRAVFTTRLSETP